jgi:hypothetical protein
MTVLTQAALPVPPGTMAARQRIREAAKTKQ